MASPFESGKDWEELSENILCVWCKQHKFKQLVQLECFHLVCKACLHKYVENPKQGTPFNCPKCDMLCFYPETFPDELLQYKMYQIYVIFSNNKPKCKSCEQVGTTSSSSSVCIACKINLCEKDAKRHQGVPNHKIIRHEMLKEERNLLLMLKSEVEICEEHSLEKSLFCKTCQIRICSECESSNHLSHELDSAVKIATEYKKTLKQRIEEVGEVRQKIKSKVNELEKTLSSIRESFRKAAEQNPAKSRRGDLKEITKETKEKESEITHKITEERNKIIQCYSTESYLKIFLRYASDSEVITKFKEFVSNLLAFFESCADYVNKSQNFQYYERPGSSTWSKERVRASPSRERPGRLEKVTNWRAGFWRGVTVCDEEFLVVDGQSLKWFSMDKKCTGNVKCTSLQLGWDAVKWMKKMYVSDWKKRRVFAVDLNGKVTDELSPALPEKENRVDGALCLAVDEKGKHLYVSSQGNNVVYKCSRESLKLVPFITKELDQPHYLCATAGNYFVVSNLGSRTVNGYDSEGTLVWKYGSEQDRVSRERQLSEPHGVCADPKGRIYIADHRNNRIVVVSIEGQHLADLDIGGESPVAVGYGNNRLVITTWNEQIFIAKWVQ